MQRLTASDATFLYMENPVVHMHVTGVLQLDPSTAPDGFSFERFRGHLISRLDRIPVFRQRVVPVPFGIDHPVWVEDPCFDIDHHLWSHTLPSPGSMEQLAAFVGSYMSRPLDRQRPLWDMVLVEGLADGTVALVSKVHHVGVDGVTGNELLAQLVDTTARTPEPGDDDVGSASHPEHIPGQVEMVADAVLSRLTDPLRRTRALARTISSAAAAAREITGGDEGHTMARPFDAPRTLFNRSITARRTVAFADAPFELLKDARVAYGCTVNDVVLAACTQSLRGYLARRGEHFDRPLVVSVPVSVRGREVEGEAINQVSDMFVRLPIHLADPVEQLREVQADTANAKLLHGAMGSTMVGDVTEVTPPVLFQLASRVYSAAGLGDRLAPIHNLVISNVPGPPVPLYVAGARLAGVYAFGPLIEGSGLNITGLSNMGRMCIGVIACPDVAPDVQEVADGVAEGIEVLHAAAATAAARASKGAARTSKKGART
jgi:WS/DGAT/MGAT family acyltransferase